MYYEMQWMFAMNGNVYACVEVYVWRRVESRLDSRALVGWYQCVYIYKVGVTSNNVKKRWK